MAGVLLGYRTPLKLAQRVDESLQRHMTEKWYMGAGTVQTRLVVLRIQKFNNA
jgi:hypothetical protein